jgi:hypothetical protein
MWWYHDLYGLQEFNCGYIMFFDLVIGICPVDSAAKSSL